MQIHAVEEEETGEHSLERCCGYDAHKLVDLRLNFFLSHFAKIVLFFRFRFCRRACSFWDG